MKNSHLSLLGHTRHTRHAGYASTNPRSTAAPTDLSGTLVAGADAWVDPYSARVGLPREQVRDFRGSHTSITKPGSEDSAVYGWVREVVTSCIGAHHACALAALGAISRGSLVAQFNGHPEEPEWNLAYEEACGLVADARQVEVVDARGFPGGDVKPSLVLRVIRASEVGIEGVVTDLQEDNQIQVESAQVALGVSAYGKDCDGAAAEIRRLIGSGPRGSLRWIQGVSATPALRDLIAEWMTVVHLSLSRNGLRPSPDDVRNEDVENFELLNQFPPRAGTYRTIEGYY